MTKDEALKLALDWLELGTFVYPTTLSIAIKEALAQPTSGDYALGYAEGFNDACKKPEQDLIPKEDLFVCGQMDAHVTRVYAQPKQEPVIDCPFCLHSFRLRDVYTTPPKREWVGLTDEHIGIILNDPNIAEVHQGAWLVLPYAYAYAIEAKLKEKNT